MHKPQFSTHCNRVYLAMLNSFSSLCRADSSASVAFWDQHYSGTLKAHTWVLAFIISKLMELGDTLFLAALQKPVIFLHW
jgi:deoxycytidine triphosphate deaminase